MVDSVKTDPPRPTQAEIDAQVKAAVLAEREACLAVIQEWIKNPYRSLAERDIGMTIATRMANRGK